MMQFVFLPQNIWYKEKIYNCWVKDNWPFIFMRLLFHLQIISLKLCWIKMELQNVLQKK